VSSDVTRDGLVGEQPGRDATTGVNAGRRRRGGGRDVMVPEATPTSYYGQPVLHRPTWEARDIAGYFFLGGLAGASSVVAAGAQLTGRPGLARVAKLGAAGAAGLSIAALVHDLGRPARFVNMLRVWKPSSPMSVGSWLLAGYVPAAGAAALCDLSGAVPAIGALATGVAALAGPAVATYTGALVADTAVPAWHDGHREMPLVFGASAASAAAGLGCWPRRALTRVPSGDWEWPRPGPSWPWRAACAPGCTRW
jgi:formate-dependent nitrite reductase membrane component NrfD